MTRVVESFYEGASTQKHLTVMTIYDVDHYTDEEKAQIVASYPAHEREARSKGIPSVGEGRVYLTAEEEITHTMRRHEFPVWWCHILGVDFGYGQSESSHPTALIWIAYDRDNDTAYVYDCARVWKPTPIKTAGVARLRCEDIDWLPVAWPHDGLQAERGNAGQTIADLHKAQGLQMLYERAKFPDGGNSVEAGIMEIDQRLKTGRLKIAAHLSEWFDEYRLYHRTRKRREDGSERSVIVKIRDDLLDATRYAIMCIRYAAQPPHDSDDYSSQHHNTGRGPAGY